MKFKSSKPLENGRVRLVIELERDEQIKAIKDHAYYRLGGQLDDVVAAHVVEDMREVQWCSVGQDWEGV